MEAEVKYLGDGCYLEVRSGVIRLYTSDGIKVTNEIFMEPEVVVSLLDFLSDNNTLNRYNLLRDRTYEHKS